MLKTEGSLNTFCMHCMYHDCCQSKRLCFFRYQSQPVPLVSVEKVNQWVENVTNGHIPNFLESIPHDVVLMLMNAVYFKGDPFHQKTSLYVCWLSRNTQNSKEVIYVSDIYSGCWTLIVLPCVFSVTVKNSGHSWTGLLSLCRYHLELVFVPSFGVTSNLFVPPASTNANSEAGGAWIQNIFLSLSY